MRKNYIYQNTELLGFHFQEDEYIYYNLIKAQNNKIQKTTFYYQYLFTNRKNHVKEARVNMSIAYS